MCWWSLRRSTAPAISERSPWTNPMTSSASVPAMGTTSGGPGAGGGGRGRPRGGPRGGWGVLRARAGSPGQGGGDSGQGQGPRGGGGLGQGRWGRAQDQELASPAASHHSPTSSSPFCRGAASSLSLFYNNGAQPCGCHEMGATGPTCEPFGGQCPCRAHVIGRVCSRCATGYWGFPSCRREYLSPRECQPGGGT